MKKKICIIGDIILDKYVSGHSHRISPEAPIPILDNPVIEYRLGGAANVAANLANIGFQVDLIGVLGKDNNSKIIKKLLKKLSISLISIEIENIPTITKTRYLANNQQILRLDNEIIFNENLNDIFMTNISSKNYSFVLFSDYKKGVIGNISNVLALCREKKITTFVDPKQSNFSSYKNADYIKPNSKELSNLLGRDDLSQKNISKDIALALKKYNFKSLIHTKSEDGIDLYNVDSKKISIKSFAKEVRDVTGAGDTVIASFCAAIATGFPENLSLMIANESASLSVSKIGAYVLTKDQFFQIISKYKYINKDYSVTLNMYQLPNLDNFKNSTIVFTNGCFDVFHLGHLKYLKKAKELGDKLIVGINSDSSIKHLKGKDRPINNLHARYEFLDSLDFIDCVIAFKEQTPLNLIKKIRPDILVKASDYDEKEVIGGEFVKSYGGVVKIVDFYKGYSSTKIINKIAKKK